MRIVGYVREPADGTRPAFGQQEELRRHAAEHGHRLVAVCQDVHAPGRPPSRDGYLSMLGVVSSGGVDAVVVPGLATFSSDQIVQEVMMWDLGNRGIRVISTDPSDLPLLDEAEPPTPSRMLIRDVLDRVGDHARAVAAHRPATPGTPDDGDVLIHLIAAGSEEADTGAPSEEPSEEGH